MPKQQVALNKFEGGLITNTNDRDIADNQFSALKGFSVDSLGGLKTLGRLKTHTTIIADSKEFNSSTLGLFAFSSDRDVSGNEVPTNYLAASDGDYIKVWDDVSNSGAGGWNQMPTIDDTLGFPLTSELGIDGTAADHILSFYAPDGDLRVCDGNFLTVNHTPKILKYISAKVYGQGDSASYPTTYAEGNIDSEWVDQDANIEHGLDSNHLKMINTGDKTKGLVEGNYQTIDESTTYFIDSIVGRTITVNNEGVDHGSLEDTDYFNGMTCSLFSANNTAIYGVVTNYTYGATQSTFEVRVGPDGNTSAEGAINNAEVETAASLWSFSIGQQDSALWNSDLHFKPENRKVISADYGVTLMFDEGNVNTGSWMPTIDTRYKFYHTTTFDASSGDMKQQESSPSLFTMYPTKQSAGTTPHLPVDKIWFRDGTSEIGSDSDHDEDPNNINAYTPSIGTPSLMVSMNFALLIRMRSDNTHSAGSNAFTVGSSSYTSNGQTLLSDEGEYNFANGDKRVTGGRIYWASSEDGFNSLNLLIDYDLQKGARTIGSGSGASNIGGYAKWQSWVYPVPSNPVVVSSFTVEEATWFAPPILETYETINGYNHDSKLDAKWKTAVLANNRVYAANVKRKEKSIFDSISFADNCTVTQSSTSVTYTDKRVRVGMRVSAHFLLDDGTLTGGNLLQPGSYVKSIESATSFELNQNPSTVVVGSMTSQFKFEGNGWNFTTEDDPSFQDRIIKSPVGKYDTFPNAPGYVLEGFNSDDGDEIIKLETFADRLLSFKRHRLQIWNIQKGGEVLEQEVLHNGLDGGSVNQSVATDVGIAWMNSKGVYFYDGRQVQSLTDNTIRNMWVGDDGYTAFWLSNENDTPIITFEPDSKKLICLKTSIRAGSADESSLIYSFKTRSWTSLSDGTSFTNAVSSRFGTYLGKLIYEDGTKTKIWNDSPSVNLSSTAGAMEILSKDIDFGAPSVRKRIYKIYITYKCDTISGDCNLNTNTTVDHLSGDDIKEGMTVTGTGIPLASYVESITDHPTGGASVSFELNQAATATQLSALTFNGSTNIQVTYGVNGESTQTKTFKNGTNFTSNVLQSGTGWIQAELKPTTSSEANNIYSFQFKFENTGLVPAQFEIDDITIIYRAKQIK